MQWDRMLAYKASAEIRFRAAAKGESAQNTRNIMFAVCGLVNLQIVAVAKRYWLRNRAQPASSGLLRNVVAREGAALLCRALCRRHKTDGRIILRGRAALGE